MRLPVIAACALLAGCAPSPASDKPVELANLASTYCVEQGGTLEIRKGNKGETGYCHLPDGSIVEEWAFFRSRQE